jgi:hypothetical protein
MNPLESRKRLLVAESEINRAQMARELGVFTANVSALADRTRSFGLIASTVAVVVAGWGALRRGKSVEAAPKSSWLRTVLKGAGLVSTLLLAFRSQERSRGDK